MKSIGFIDDLLAIKDLIYYVDSHLLFLKKKTEDGVHPSASQI